MVTIKDRFYFVFDDKKSRDFGLLSAELGTGMYEESFGPSRAINETTIIGRDEPIFHGVQDEKVGFEMNIIFEKNFDEAKINEIQKWLFKDYYKPLYFEGLEDRIIYCMFAGDTNIIHNGLNEGYFTVTVFPKTPYKLSRLKTATKTITTSGFIDLENKGHKIVYPEISIKKIGSGDLTINVNGINVKIVNLSDGEDIYIDTQREIIQTNLAGQYRYDNIVAGELSDLYLNLGLKRYTITGSCTFSYRFREKYRF